ncbi:hypothetical protein [Salipiger sp.]|uniref:hypothetical protein n=1 Tax=Salipiger sp. TaxID=2078585 RepID=UPI003A971CF4
MTRAALALCLLAAGCAQAPGAVPALSGTTLESGGARAGALAAPSETDADGGFLDAPAPAASAGPGAESDAERGGLLGFFARRAASAKAAESAPGEASPDGTAATASEQSGGGLAALFGGGGKGPAPDAPDFRQVGPGTTLPFGEMARLCGVPEHALGTRIATYPENRRNGYALYDTAPGGSGARTLFLTGFPDGCARQLTGALAMFGSAEMHEELRYGPAGKTLPRSTTDAAYEKVKAGVCKVASGKPCGRALSRLEKDTAFVTVYPAFGSRNWLDILLHDGAVVAVDRH